jgi:Dolichyl-phosphate-mannose-protein mannosyltransferase
MSAIPADSTQQQHRHPLYIGLIALTTGFLHLIVAGRYNLFRNELYFIVCGRHPAFGYFDQPPLVPLLAAATQIFGKSTFLCRLPAVAAAVAMIPVTVALTRLFRKDTVSVVLAAVAAAITPAIAGLTATLTTSTFEPVAWTACAFFLTRAMVLDDRRALCWAGLIIGVSMEIKYGIAMWMIGLVVGLIVTPERRIFGFRSCWVGLGIAAVIAAPSLIWQAVHGWPFLALIRQHHDTGANLTGSPLVFEIREAIDMNLFLAPLWIAGVIAPFTAETLKRARFLSVAFVVATVVNITTGGKSYYLFAAYPTMFAVGAAALGGLRRWLVGLWLITATMVFGLLLPLALPVLSPDHLVDYMRRLHFRPRPIEIAGIGAPLTQVFSDEMGWEEMEKEVAKVYRSLPIEDQKRAAILATNYGDAAAIDFYGKADNLPPVISGANQYFLWGPRGHDGSVMIIVNSKIDRWTRFCGRVQEMGRFGSPYAMPYEYNRPILVCNGLRFGLERAWPHFERYD